MIDDLVLGRHNGAWSRRGDWAFDSRIELTGASRGDYTTWLHVPRSVADGYLPKPSARRPRRRGFALLHTMRR